QLFAARSLRSRRKRWSWGDERGCLGEPVAEGNELFRGLGVRGLGHIDGRGDDRQDVRAIWNKAVGPGCDLGAVAELDRDADDSLPPALYGSRLWPACDQQRSGEVRTGVCDE